MKGWLLDTNVIATLISPNDAPAVKAWAANQGDETLHLGVLTLGEYDKGINDLSGGHSHRSRYTAARDALEARLSGRILFVSDDVVRRGGRISGAVKRDTGHLPSVVDTILAATVIEHELFLVTRNVRDVQLSGATISNP